MRWYKGFVLVRLLDRNRNIIYSFEATERTSHHLLNSTRSKAALVPFDGDRVLCHSTIVGRGCTGIRLALPQGLYDTSVSPGDFYRGATL